MPSKIKKRGKNTYLLSVVHQQKEYTKTITAESKPDAEREWKLFSAEVIQNKVVSGDTPKMTLAAFYRYWKHHHAEKNLERTSIAYNNALFARIEAALGHLKMDKVLPRHILAFLDQLAAVDASCDNKPLSPNTIRKHYNLLKTLFNAAERWQFIVNNPMNKITPPKQVKPHKQILNEDSMSILLEKLAQEPVKHQLWVLLAFSRGLRREEIFGLKWGDIDIDMSKITIARAAVYIPKEGIIVKDTKSDNSFRTLALPADISALLQVWKNEVISIEKRRNKRRKTVSLDDPVKDDKWVFAKFDGSVGHPHSFNTFLRRFRIDNDLPAISPHLLRHMTGSYLLNSGIDIAAVSAELGHSNKSFTMKTYIHALESTKEQSALVMQDILSNLKTRPQKDQSKDQSG